MTKMDKISIMGNGEPILKPQASGYFGVEHLTRAKVVKKAIHVDVSLSDKEKANNKKSQDDMRAFCKANGLQYTTQKMWRWIKMFRQYLNFAMNQLRKPMHTEDGKMFVNELDITSDEPIKVKEVKWNLIYFHLVI